MLELWAVNGHVPDFVEPSISGVGTGLAVLVKIAGGLTAAILLWLMRRSGRALAGFVAGTDILHTSLVAAQAGALGTGAVWATISLNALLLLAVALPASGRACCRAGTAAKAASRR